MGTNRAVDREHLDGFVEDAANRGVEVEVDLHCDHLWLGSIERLGPMRGAGGIVLQELLEIADDWDLPVRCAVDSSIEPLLDWYLGLGFEIETMSDEDGGRPDHAILVRTPGYAPLRARSLHLQEA